MNIQFLGASNLVTGSMFLLSIGDKKILIDSGMFQGLNEEKYNYLPLQFDPKEIYCVILTHSHLDHCGLIPLLVKRGFNGPIYSTIQTKLITEVILLDSARLQEIRKKELRSDDILYDMNDAYKSVSQFVEIKFFDEIEINKDIKFKFIPAGHILGASSVVINNNGVITVFSGDIGRTDQSIIKSFKEYDFKQINPTNIVMESLYGGIEHTDREAEKIQMYRIIKETLAKNGTVYIPVFSLHRAQEMLAILRLGIVKDYLPKDINIYLDSPMANSITKIYLDNSSEFSEEFITTNMLNPNSDNSVKINPFFYDQVELVKKSKKSQRITSTKKSIILAGSGMADGGRIVGHIYKNIEDKRNSFIFVGFQAEGTLGRKLTDGASEILVEDKDLVVRSSVFNLRGFSAHADNEDLLSWVNSFNLNNLNKVILIHAEKNRISAFGKELEKNGIKNWVAPNMYDKIDLP